MIDTSEKAEPLRPALPPPSRPRFRRRWLAAAALLGAFLVGAGVTGLAMRRPQVILASLTPVPINTMAAGSAVAVKGKVSDLFGRQFVVDDGTGRALVDTGSTGESTPFVAASETVTVQGRFDRGVLRAAAITHSDGKSDLIGPSGPPSPPSRFHGPLAWLDPRR